MQQVITPGPAAVRRAAKSRHNLGGYIIYIGQYQDQSVYTCAFDEAMTIGEPEVYLWDGKKVTTITGENAFEFLNPYNL
jgi:hypothetical protein